jgi:hypothetical protein
MSLASQVTALATRIGQEIKALRGSTVLLSGDQTVAGIKTFTSRLVSTAPVRGADFELTSPAGAFAFNATWNGTAWVRINAGRALLFRDESGNGNLTVLTAPSDVAGSTIAWSVRARMGESGVFDGATRVYSANNPPPGGGGGASGPELGATADYVTTTPATPATGLTLFTRFRARRLPSFLGPLGQDSQLQPALFSNRIARWNAVNGATAPSIDGLAVTAVGTAAAQSVAATNFYTGRVRMRYSSTTTAGAAAGIRSTTAQWFLSSTPNEGGFFFVARVGLGVITATNRVFVGLSTTAAALAAGTNPSAFLSMIGFGCDSTHTTLRFMCNDASGTATMVDLGANFPSQTAATQFYEFRLFAPSGGGQRVFWSAHRLNDGAVVSGEVTADLPALNALLAAHIHHSNGTTAAAASIDIQSLYIESDN